MLNPRRLIAAVALAAVAALVPVAAHAADKPSKGKVGKSVHTGNGPMRPTGWGWGG